MTLQRPVIPASWRLLALSTVTWCLMASPTVAQCQRDADLSGLISVLQASQEEASQDAARALLTYRVERDALCREIEALRAESVANRAALAATESVTSLVERERDLYRDAYQRALTRREPASRPPFGWTLGAGGCTDMDGRLSLCGAAVWGWRF